MNKIYILTFWDREYNNYENIKAFYSKEAAIEEMKKAAKIAAENFDIDFKKYFREKENFCSLLDYFWFIEEIELIPE